MSMLTDLIEQVLKKAKDQKSSSGVEKEEDDISDAVTKVIESMPENREARVYALTYVNTFGDESAPSTKDEMIYLAKGDMLTLTIPYATGEREALVRDYGVNAIRLYRSVTNSSGVAQFLFVKEAIFNMTGDSIAITDELPQGSLLIGEPLPTINYDPPRDNIKGLGVTDYGVGYAYIDKTLCFSEPYILYAWPRYYELSSQYKVMGMGHYDNAIVVATTGNPILINGISPESMSVLSLPLYEGCVSSRSMVNLNHGCMYASNNGLVLVTTNSAKLLTEDVFSTDDWQKIKPSSIHACAYKNGYLFFWNNETDKGSGYIDLNSANKGVLWFDDHTLNTFVDDAVIQMVSSEPDGYGVDRSVYRSFNPEYGQPFINKVLVWRSKTFNTDVPKRFLAGQVIADDYPIGDIIFRVYGDGVLLHESTVKDTQPFRVANHSAKRDFSIEIESSVSVREVALGETMRDMIK